MRSRWIELRRFRRRSAALALALACLTARAIDMADVPAGVSVLREVDYAGGAHPRQKLDLFRPDRAAPTPLAIYIHGGGFSGGDKEKLNPDDRRRLLEAGIAVASINYRFYRDAPLPAAFADAARALQFLRFRAREWNLQPTRVAAFGGSAGAQIAMYLAFHDDLAEAGSADPVARQSTRLTCVATTGGQITMDAAWWRRHVPDHDITQTDPRAQFGVADLAEAQRRLLAVAAIGLLSRDDPPIFMAYGMAPGQPYPADRQAATGWKFHHVVHGLELQTLARTHGVELHLKYPGAQVAYGGVIEFLTAKLSPGTERTP